MKNGYLYLEALLGISIFMVGVVCIAGCYLTIWNFMLRHEAKEKATLLAEAAVISLRQHREVITSSGDLTLTIEKKENLWPGKLTSKELKVFYKEEQEPLYNLFIYE